MTPLPPLPSVPKPWEWVEPSEPRRRPERSGRSRGSRPANRGRSLPRRAVRIGLAVLGFLLGLVLGDLMWDAWLGDVLKPEPEPSEPIAEWWTNGRFYQCHAEDNRVSCDSFNHIETRG